MDFVAKSALSLSVYPQYILFISMTFYNLFIYTDVHAFYLHLIGRVIWTVQCNPSQYKLRTIKPKVDE